MTKKTPGVGPLEMQVLGIVRSQRHQSVADIQDNLKLEGHTLAYTTVMTVLSRLHKKGLIKRKKEGRQYLYEIESKKSSSPSKILEKVKNSLFGTEKLKPILGLLDAEDSLTREELKKLRKAIDDKIKRAKK